jgi:regulator of nucleoside diphosphate kinase
MADAVAALGAAYRGHARQLNDRLSQLAEVPAAEVAADVVTMDTRVRLRDIDTERSWEAILSYPGNSPAPSLELSVLTQLGMELLGSRVGDVIEWKVPGGIRRLEIEEILFQPEAAKDWTL